MLLTDEQHDLIKKDGLWYESENNRFIDSRGNKVYILQEITPIWVLERWKRECFENPEKDFERITFPNGEELDLYFLGEVDKETAQYIIDHNDYYPPDIFFDQQTNKYTQHNDWAMYPNDGTCKGY
jgi:hypothetical protein